jgi:transcriptional regulator
MKTRIFLFIIAALSVLTLAARENIFPSGRLVSQQRVCPSGFTGVNVSSAFDLVLENGPEHKLRVECRENVMPVVETVISRGTIIIRLKEGVNLRGDDNDVKVYLTMPTLTKLTASVACEIETRGTMSSDLPLSILLSGACEMDGGFSAGTIDIQASGAADCDLRLVSGSTASITLSGAGDIEASMECGDLVLDISGAADIDLNGKCKDLKVKASGACSLECYGLVAASVSGHLSGASSGYFTSTGPSEVTGSVASTVRVKRPE